MFSTGSRIGEIVALEKNHINWSNQSAIARGKGDKEREVYFNIRCEIWLKRYIESRYDNNTAIFVTARQPHKMSVAQMRYIIKRISNRAEINKEIHPHQLRHSYATHLLNNGAPIEIIQSLMEHEKSETTRIYAQLKVKERVLSEVLLNVEGAKSYKTLLLLTIAPFTLSVTFPNLTWGIRKENINLENSTNRSIRRIFTF